MARRSTWTLRSSNDVIGELQILNGVGSGVAGDPDFEILCAIQEAPLDGPAVWARRAGVDATTLRRRVRRLEQHGVLRGFAATPAAAAFGRTPTTLEFHTAQPPDMDAILAVEDVAWAASTYDQRTWVNIYEGEDRTQELEELLGPSTTTYTTAEPAPTVLGRIELKVLRALILEPRAGIQRLTEMTGLSSKTVRNHRASLISRRLVRIDPLLRPPRTAGRMYYHVTVHLDGSVRPQVVQAATPDAIVISHYNDGQDLYMFCAAAGLQEQAERVEALRHAPGVTDVTVVVTREYGLATQRLTRWCDEAIAAWM